MGGISVKDVLLGQLISNFGVPEKNPGYAPMNVKCSENISVRFSMLSKPLSSIA